MAEQTLAPARKPAHLRLRLSTRTRYHNDDGYYGLPKIDRMIDARRSRDADTSDAIHRRERIQERWTLYREGQRLAHIMLPILKARGAVPKHDQDWINSIARLYTCAYPRPEGDTNARLAVMLDALRRAYVHNREKQVKAKAADPLGVVLVAPIPAWLNDPITVPTGPQRIRVWRESNPNIKLLYTKGRGLAILNRPQRRRSQRATERKYSQDTGFSIALPLNVFPDSLERRRCERDLAAAPTYSPEARRLAELYQPRAIAKYRGAFLDWCAARRMKQ